MDDEDGGDGGEDDEGGIGEDDGDVGVGVGQVAGWEESAIPKRVGSVRGFGPSSGLVAVAPAAQFVPHRPNKLGSRCQKQ